MVLSGIRPSFPSLSRSAGQITHVLLTRSPLEHPHQKMMRAFPFDLHVLSTPPAFVLSQDRTLQKNKQKITGKKQRNQQNKNKQQTPFSVCPCSCSCSNNKICFIKWHTIEFSNNTTTHNTHPKQLRAVNSDHTNIQTPPQNHKPPAHNNKISLLLIIRRT